MTTRDRWHVVARCLAFLLAANFFSVTVVSQLAPGQEQGAPSGASALQAYERTVREHADVEWHIALVRDGYEQLDAGGRPPGFWQWPQRNWAFFPLTPLLARVGSGVLRSIGLEVSPFWMLWGVAQLALLLLLVLFAEWSRLALGPGARRGGWVLLVAFVLPPVAFSTNFVVLPLLLFAVALYALDRALHERVAGAWPWIAAVACVLAGLARAQGLLLNGAVLALLLLRATWLHLPVDRRVALLAGANALPGALVLALFQHRAGDPLAFAKIQAAWGRRLSAPWTPWVEYLQSGRLVDLHHDDLVFTGLRCGLFVGFAIAGARRVAAAGSERRAGGTDRRVYALWAIALGLLFALLPSTSGTLLSAHRYLTFAFPGVAVWLACGGVLPVGWMVGLLALRCAELVLFFRGWHVFTW